MIFCQVESCSSSSTRRELNTPPPQTKRNTTTKTSVCICECVAALSTHMNMPHPNKCPPPLSLLVAAVHAIVAVLRDDAMRTEGKEMRRRVSFPSPPPSLLLSQLPHVPGMRKRERQREGRRRRERERDVYGSPYLTTPTHTRLPPLLSLSPFPPDSPL